MRLTGGSERGMRKVLPGIASATKKLAAGTRRTYYYAWRGGPLLKAQDGTPLQPEDPRFFVAYTDAHRARRVPMQGTLFSLIALFTVPPQSSPLLLRRRAKIMLATSV